MSKVIRAMKKVYWKGRKKIKKLPPVKAAKKYMGRKRKDKLLYETLPAAYNATVSAFCMMSCKEILTWISMYICCEILLSQEKNTSDAVKRCWPMRQLQNTSL